MYAQWKSMPCHKKKIKHLSGCEVPLIEWFTIGIPFFVQTICYKQKPHRGGGVRDITALVILVNYLFILWPSMLQRCPYPGSQTHAHAMIASHHINASFHCHLFIDFLLLGSFFKPQIIIKTIKLVFFNTNSQVCICGRYWRVSKNGILLFCFTRHNQLYRTCWKCFTIILKNQMHFLLWH